MEKAFEIQKQIRDNSKTLNSYLTDLQNWEAEMKRKEAALSGEFEQEIPPVRSKVKKEDPEQVKKKPESRISASDYLSWEKFDVDKACEDIDMEDVGPTSLDSKASQPTKMEKLREEAQLEKERGNYYVKQEKWDDAIACYDRAIHLVNDNAVYFANRALCYLKKDHLHQAERDCSEALRLDRGYVKALQRRAAARERLGSLRAACTDLAEVLRLEPRNRAAATQLTQIKLRMGTKGLKSKSSPSSTPALETMLLPKAKVQPMAHSKTVESEEPQITQEQLTAIENWKKGVGENVTILRPVKKPVHLRSKRTLKSIPIQEIPLGNTSPEKPPTRLKIIEIDSNKGCEEGGDGDVTTETKEMASQRDIKRETIEIASVGDFPTDTKKMASLGDFPTETKKMASLGDFLTATKELASPESVKLTDDAIALEKEERMAQVPPANSVQFMAEWKYLRGNDGARSDYFSIIDPSKIPAIFDNALESDVLSDVLRMLHDETGKFKRYSVLAYLTALTKVKRFSTLAMFLSSQDKLFLSSLLDHCKNVENCNENDIADLKNKYEL